MKKAVIVRLIASTPRGAWGRDMGFYGVPDLGSGGWIVCSASNRL